MLKDSINIINEKIEKALLKSNRKREEITIIGVTKKKNFENIIDSYKSGIKDIGENYVQEANTKIGQVKENLKEEDFNKINFHFIGTLQTNKIKHLKDFSYIHSVYKEKHIEELIKRFQKINIFIEVNISEELNKSGTTNEKLPYLIENFLKLNKDKKINLLGLMTMPPFDIKPDITRKYFLKLRELRESINSSFNIDMKYLSMGMSNDFEIAIEEGATHVRIGTLLYGERN